MPLAALSFADPLMLAGLVAALIPVALHLLNQMRAPVVPFPTLRFLKITAEKTARRRHIQQYFLLLLRVIVFALIAMAVAAPLIRGGSATLAYGLVLMLLAALALLVLAAVLSSLAIGKQKAAPTAPLVSITTNIKPSKPANAYFGFSFLALLAALLLGGYAAYGLVSDRFFSGTQGEFTGRSTAMVIIFDNSHSMLATVANRDRLSIAKAQMRELLGQTIRPAEAAILPTNHGDQSGTPGLTTDMTRLAGYLDQLSPRGAARPMQERITTALDMLRGSTQSNKMLVIASDFSRPVFADAEAFASLKKLPWRKDLQIVLFPIGRDKPADADVGIASFSLAEGTQRPVVGTEITFDAQFINNSDTSEVRDYSLLMDGNPVNAPAQVIPSHIQLGPAGTGPGRQTIKITHRLGLPGSHHFTLRLENPPAATADALAWDDQRELTLDVANQMQVLVIGPDPADARGLPRSRSAAFYLHAALNPFEGIANTPWSVRATYRGVSQLEGSPPLSNYSALFLCDIPKIPPALADGLADYAKSGGRIIWILGPGVVAADYNTQLAGTRQLLPATLAQPLSTTTAAPLDWVDLQSGLFMNLFDSQQPFRTALISGRWSLAGDVQGRTMARLADGSPLFIEHRPAGSAESTRIYTLLTSPTAAWSNLGATVLLVPLASRMALGDFSQAGKTSVDVGTIAEINVPSDDKSSLANLSLDITLPDNTVINLKPSPAAGKWFFDRTYTEGIYHWKTSGSATPHEGMVAVNPPGPESDLLSADVAALAKESNPPITSPGKQTITAASIPDLLLQLQQRSEGTSLAPGFISMVLIFALMEALIANRLRTT